MPNGGKRQLKPLTRRGAILLGAGFTAGVAGCLGDDDDADDVIDDSPLADDSDDMDDLDDTGADDSDDAPDGDQVRTDFRVMNDTDTNPLEWNVNYYDPAHGRGMHQVDNLVNDHLMLDLYEPEWHGHMVALEDWEFDGCTATYTLRDDMYWWDGTQVTTADLYTDLVLNEYTGLSHKGTLELEYEIVDDFTLRRHRLRDPIAEQIEKPAPYRLDHKEEFWGEWVERYDDAAEDRDAWGEITVDLQEFHFDFDTFLDESLGAGLWIPDDLTELSMTLVKNEDHRRADWTNLEEFYVEWVPESQMRIEMARNDQVDMGRVFDDNNLEYVRNFPINGGRSITFRVADSPHIARREVRQAIAYIFDHEEVLEIADATLGDVPHLPPKQHGITHATDEMWLGADWMEDNLIDYGSTSKPDEAEERMETAGYEMQGDVWVDENGEPAEGIRLVIPEADILTILGQYIESVLDEFGIKLDMMITTWAEHSNIWQNTREFDILDGWISGTHPSQTQFHTFSLMDSTSEADPAVVEWPDDDTDPECEYSDPPEPNYLMDEHPDWGIPIQDTYPEIGDEDGEPVNTLDPARMHRIMQRNPDEDEVREVVREVAWYLNWKMLHFEYYNEVWQYSFNTAEFEVDDHPETYSRNSRDFLRGHINSLYE